MVSFSMSSRWRTRIKARGLAGHRCPLEGGQGGPRCPSRQEVREGARQVSRQVPPGRGKSGGNEPESGE